LTAAAAAAPVGVLGGTFNPVHHGHLRSALELVERLDLARLHLMPSAQPPHREAPDCSAEDRAAMVELAVRGEPRLVCDRRELRRAGPSYSFDSLISLRAELGAERSLCLSVGFDAVAELDGWHRWRELLDLAHLVVIARPGWQLPQGGEVAEWLAQHRVHEHAALRAAPAGGVLVETLRPLDISATDIRALLAAGRSARFLLPDSVLGYIESHHLYQAEEARVPSSNKALDNLDGS
jgi:nicotinate-nucleotide adenylyltransferase